MVIVDNTEYLSEEEKRLKEDRERTNYWKKWGPYTAERQWATGTCCYASNLTYHTLTVFQFARTTRKHTIFGVCGA